MRATIRTIALMLVIGFGGRYVFAGQAERVLDTSLLDPSGQHDVSLLINDFVKNGNVTARLPCGTFKITHPLALPSDTTLVGSGDCTVLKLSVDSSPSLVHQLIKPNKGDIYSIITNKNAGDRNILLSSFKADGELARKNAHLVSFYKVHDVVIGNLTLKGAGLPATQDAISFINSSDFLVENNRCSGFANACYDQWDSSERFRIRNNFADGLGIMSYGILVNGISGADSTDAASPGIRGKSSNFIVEGNVVKNVTNIGVAAYGLCSPSRRTCGNVSTGTIRGNRILNVTKYYGIYVGNAQGINVQDNSIIDAATNGVRIAAQNSGGITKDIRVVQNFIQGRSSGEAAISIGTEADTVENVFLSGNLVHGYHVRLKRGSKTTVHFR